MVGCALRTMTGIVPLEQRRAVKPSLVAPCPRPCGQGSLFKRNNPCLLSVNGAGCHPRVDGDSLVGCVLRTIQP